MYVWTVLVVGDGWKGVVELNPPHVSPVILNCAIHTYAQHYYILCIKLHSRRRRRRPGEKRPENAICYTGATRSLR